MPGHRARSRDGYLTHSRAITGGVQCERGRRAPQAALRAAVEGLEMCGGGEAEREPPAGLLGVPLMRHQRLALAWMLRREALGAKPLGGILADDQARPGPRGRVFPGVVQG